MHSESVSTKQEQRREIWRQRIAEWKVRYPACLPEYAREQAVNPYWFVKQLAAQLHDDEIIVSDTGCALAWMMQAFEFKGHVATSLTNEEV